MSTPAIGGNALTSLRSYVERIERLSSEKDALTDDIKLVYDELGSSGFDKKAIRKLIAERKRDASDVAEETALIDTYKKALGPYVSTPLGQSAIDRAARNGPTETMLA